jgi:hypothetical protein
VSWSDLRALGRTTSTGDWEFPSSRLGDAISVIAEMRLQVVWTESRLYQPDGSFVVPGVTPHERADGEEWVAFGLSDDAPRP